MEDMLKRLPNWLVLAAAAYLVILVSYAVFDNRSVEFWPPVIHGKDGSRARASTTQAIRPWVSIDTVTPNFPVSDCPLRLPGWLGRASAANVQPATWGGNDGRLWFADLRGNTVWLACHQVGVTPLILVGAAGPEPQSTKAAIDVLLSVISK